MKKSVYRRSLGIAVAAVLVLCAVGFPVSARRRAGGAKAYVLVDIDRIGPARLAELETTPDVEWWVELDDQLLVCVDAERLPAAFASASYRILDAPVRPETLRTVYELRRVDAEAAGITVLARGGRAAIVQATDAQLERLALAHPDADGHGSHAVVREFRPNSVLARQAANDAASLAKTAATSFDVPVQTLVDSVDGNRWFADDQMLATWNRNSRQPGNATARDWLVQQFQALPGLTVTTQSFSIPGSPAVTSYNVVATLTGTTRPNDWYIVGGHFDTTSQNVSQAAPGAEDNGSGTAAVLEMARIFTAHPPDATIIFICYSGEEQGLYGSTAHASSLVASGDNTKMRAALIMDMIGYTGDADLDCLLETSTIGQPMVDAYSAAAAQYTTLRIVTSLNPFGSDHVPYLNRNMPAMLAIENDWDSYPNYHRTTDTPNNITIDMGVQIIRMDVGALALMVGQPPASAGTDTAGIYSAATSTFFLRNANTPGAADLAFQFGAGGFGYVPLTGDWNGDGADSVGLYDPATGTFYLKNTNTPGAADIAFQFGAGGTGAKPVVGDWDGNGTDTVGLYIPASGTFFLRNTNTPGVADLAFGYGPPNVTPVVGDWDGNGTDTVGVYVGSTSTFFLRNANSPGNADLAFGFGGAGLGWVPITGDWNGDGADTIGLYQPTNGSFFLRDSNTAGNASTVFGYGPAGAVPLRGDWNNQ